MVALLCRPDTRLLTIGKRSQDASAQFCSPATTDLQSRSLRVSHWLRADEPPSMKSLCRHRNVTERSRARSGEAIQTASLTHLGCFALCRGESYSS